ncbi:hypothetical protein H6CHR_00294 [Variovorax sp. PBL-H6]|nr:hypothetical protein H6CHR_00294 [Variovorax sp. PBL-H6]
MIASDFDLLPLPLGEGWGEGTGPSICTLRLFGGRSRGVVPAAESLSFASPKESNQRKGDPTARDPSLRYGQPAVLAFRGVRANSLRSNTRGPDPRKAPLLGTRRGEWGPFGPLLRSATNGLAARGLEQVRAYAPQREHEHEHGHEHKHEYQYEHKYERELVQVHVLRVRVRVRVRVRESQRERGPREKRAPQVARSEAEGRGQWGRLFFGYFLLAKQKKVTRLPGRHPGSGLNTSARYQSTARCPHPNPLPEGEGATPAGARRAEPRP